METISISFYSLQFRPTNRDKSPVPALFVEVGDVSQLFICATQGDIQRVAFKRKE